MTFDVETQRLLTDIYWLLLGMGGLMFLGATVGLLLDRTDWPMLVATGGVSLLWLIVLVPQLFMDDPLLPGVPLVEYTASPEATADAIEDRYDVVVYMPDDADLSTPVDLRVVSGDQFIECVLEPVGDPTVDGQEFALRCDGGDLPSRHTTTPEGGER